MRAFYRIIFIAFFVLLNGILLAQPSFYNTNASGNQSASPLDDGLNKCQWIFGPDLFRSGGLSGTQAGTGKIDNVYINLGVKYLSVCAYTHFTVKLGQNADTATVFKNTNWVQDLTTVFYAENYSISGASGSWVKIPLQQYFKYDPTKSLVVEISVYSGLGCNLRMNGTKSKQRLIGITDSSTAKYFGTGLINFGFDISTPVNNNAAVLNFTKPLSFCEGLQDVNVLIANNGTNKIDSLRINWSVDDTLQTPIYYTQAIDTFGATNSIEIKLGNVYFNSGNLRKIKAWTSHPNGQTDTFNADDTAIISLQAALSGNYTVGGTNADFKTLTEAANRLNFSGVCGPVKFNIAKGTYKEQLLLNTIKGTSEVNTISFIGEERANTIIEHDGTTTTDWQTILINACNYITIKNVTIKALDATYAVGAHFTGSNNCILDSCDIELSTTSSGFKLYGILGSGTQYESLPGNSGNNNTFSNLKINGGYKSIYYTGTSSGMLNTGNKFIKNTFTNYLRYAIDILALGKTVIDSNTVICTRDANTSGFYLSAMADFSINANYIKVRQMGVDMWYSNYYYRYNNPEAIFSNNMIVTTTTAGLCLQYTYSRNVKIYHNSMYALEAACVNFRYSDSTDVRNNIFANSGNIGNFFTFQSPANSFGIIDNNIYYASNPPSVGPVNIEGTYYTSFASWFSSVSSFNKNSFVQDPKFVSSDDLHLQKGKRPTGAKVNILDDFDGIKRCLVTPTIGAHELKKGTIADTANPVNICAGDTLKFTIFPPSGFSSGDYGTKWSIENFSFKTSKNTLYTNYKITNPTSLKNGFISIYPDTTETDSAYFLSFSIVDSAKTGCDSLFGRYIKIYPKVNANFNTDKTEICLGDSIQFINNSTIHAQIKYLWLTGDDQTFTTKNLTHKYKIGGIYKATLIAFSPGCIDSSSKTITVNSIAGASIIQGKPYNGQFKNGSVTNADMLCAGDTLTYDILAPAGFSNKEFKSHWEISKLSIEKNNGQLLHDTATFLPDSVNNFRVRFIAGNNLNGDTLLLKVHLTNTRQTCKDSTMVRYMAVGYKPQAKFTYKAACLGQGDIYFYDSTYLQKGTYTKQWNFGDGDFSIANNPTHTYKDTGIYSVKLHVFADKGCSDEFTKTIRINKPPKVKFSHIGQCSKMPYLFFDSTITYAKNAQRLWKFGDGGTDTSAIAEHIYENAGSYTVVLIYTDVNGCIDSASSIIIVKEKPEPDFDIIASCIGEAIKFTNKTKFSGNTILSYNWYVDDSLFSQLENSVHTFNSNKNFSVKLVVNTANGCADSVTKFFNPNPKPKAGFSFNKDSACAGESMQFKLNNIQNNLNYSWNFGDGNTSTDSIAEHTYSSGGKYKVVLKLTNSSGCADSTEKEITILNAPLVVFTAANICLGEKMIFNNTSITDSGATFYWDFGDGNSSTQKDAEHTYIKSGQYNVTLKITNYKRSCADENTITATVFELPQINFSASTISGSKIKLTPDNLNFQTYKWDFGDGDSSKNISPEHQYNTGGNYTVKLSVTDNNGCANEVSNTINVSANGLSAGFKNTLKFNIYPNPSANIFYLAFELDKPQNILIELYDLQGRKLKQLTSGKRVTGKHMLDINSEELNMAAGIYNIRIVTNDGQFINKIILVK